MSTYLVRVRKFCGVSKYVWGVGKPPRVSCCKCVRWDRPTKPSSMLAVCNARNTPPSMSDMRKQPSESLLTRIFSGPELFCSPRFARRFARLREKFAPVSGSTFRRNRAGKRVAMANTLPQARLCMDMRPKAQSSRHWFGFGGQAAIVAHNTWEQAEQHPKAAPTWRGAEVAEVKSTGAGSAQIMVKTTVSNQNAT